MERAEAADQIPEPTHLKAPGRGRSVLLALAALALASPAYLYAALNKPAVVVRLNDALLSAPDRVVVKVGEAVVWRNESREVRTLEVHEGEERRSAVLAPGESYEHVFRTAGLHRFDAADKERDVSRDGVVTVEP